MNQATLHSIEYYAKRGDDEMRKHIDMAFSFVVIRILILFYMGVELPVTMAEYNAMTTYEKLGVHERISSIWLAQDTHVLRQGISDFIHLMGY